ncbi:PD-(D/E)XK nuclease family protein [Candidatus Woesearchaeota archaeon]|nr:PD-(D/E)XK nuclease family protein [Candidatus Woesearchaeota archaeon]
MYKFSPSSLSLLKDCPRCFWLRYRKNIKRPDTPFPSLPSGMDKVLKEHFDRFMKRGEVPAELTETGCTLFDDEEKLKEWRSVFKGIRWTDRKGNLFRGAVDNILVKGKKLVVLDYKTRGYPVKEDTHEHYQDQMDIYNFLLRKNGHPTTDYAYLLFYHPKYVHRNGSVDFEAKLIKMKINVKNAEKIFKKAVTVLDGDKPKPGKECKFCKWCEEI